MQLQTEHRSAYMQIESESNMRSSRSKLSSLVMCLISLVCLFYVRYAKIGDVTRTRRLRDFFIHNDARRVFLVNNERFLQLPIIALTVMYGDFLFLACSLIPFSIVSVHLSQYLCVLVHTGIPAVPEKCSKAELLLCLLFYDKVRPGLLLSLVSRYLVPGTWYLVLHQVNPKRCCCIPVLTQVQSTVTHAQLGLYRTSVSWKCYTVPFSNFCNKNFNPSSPTNHHSTTHHCSLLLFVCLFVCCLL